MELNLVFHTLFLLASFLLASAANNVERKPYIVYMGSALESRSLAMKHHDRLLLQVIKDEEVARKSKIYSYGKSFNAFAAKLLPHEAQKLQENKKVVSVFPSTERKLLTTRSWDFMGMPLSVKRNTQTESDIIIGLLDTGIDIENPSFNDEGFGPPPSKWKGSCQKGANFSGCNNKVIGARLYRHSGPGDQSVYDRAGHGTHTASTAAGIAVKDVSLYGLGEGTARGGVPSARIAMYKVCSPRCQDVDIMAAFDDAIDDGLDIISVSLGSEQPVPFYKDSVAIGSFHALEKGILTSCAAGNEGPSLSTISSNGAPWIMTVGASYMDRQFRTPVVIGDRNDSQIMGISVNTFNLTEMYPLIKKSEFQSRDGAAARQDDDDDDDISGKIVLTEEGYYGEVIKGLNGTGMIFVCRFAFGAALPLPAACVDLSVADDIFKYIKSTDKPVASILKSVEIQDTSAPYMVSFSSRGPSAQADEPIIKPDIVAPGVEILAGYTKYVSVSESPLDDRYSQYNVLSGTSMACPHAAGAAAYVKSFHPDWSPSAIKSALMTTATEIKVKDEVAEFAYGAGHIDPTKAAEPGLVYDMDVKDYYPILCDLGYDEEDLELIVGEPIDCSSIPKLGGVDNLNYPTMLVMQNTSKSTTSAVFHRSVKNVGSAESTYKATVTAAEGLNIKVTPDTLSFKQVNEVLSFKVEVEVPASPVPKILSSSLVWSHHDHHVRSPILVFPHYRL